MRDKAKFKNFRNIAVELSIAKGVILLGTRIVIPTSLQNKVIKIAFEAGASRTGQDNNCPGPEYGFLRSTTGVSCY